MGGCQSQTVTVDNTHASNYATCSSLPGQSCYFTGQDTVYAEYDLSRRCFSPAPEHSPSGPLERIILERKSKGK